MQLSKRFDDAVLFALEKHRAQERKGSGAPYATHLLAVAALIGEFGGDEDQMISGVLHDCMEDQGVTADDLIERFGEHVAHLVIACTDTILIPKPPWRPRKETYLASLAVQPAEVKLVVCADKLHNAQSIRRDLLDPRVGQAVWSKFSVPRSESLWYYRSVVIALATGWEHLLLNELREMVAKLDPV